MARLIELIETQVMRGDGTEGNPFRHCPQLWTKAGQLVAEHDPHTGVVLFSPVDKEFVEHVGAPSKGGE